MEIGDWVVGIGVWVVGFGEWIVWVSILVGLGLLRSAWVSGLLRSAWILGLGCGIR